MRCDFELGSGCGMELKWLADGGVKRTLYIRQMVIENFYFVAVFRCLPLL